MWLRTPLALEQTDKDYPSIENDEISVIGNNNNAIWAFGIIDRSNKQARAFYAMNNRSKETLLLLIKNNINKINCNIDSLELTTRVLPNCLTSYRDVDFNNMHFILHSINNSACLMQVPFIQEILKVYGLESKE